MQNEKESIIKILWEQGAIQFGNFKLKSSQSEEKPKGIQLIIPHQRIQCPKCETIGMNIWIYNQHQTPYGDGYSPGFRVDFLCPDINCNYIMSGNLYES